MESDLLCRQYMCGGGRLKRFPILGQMTEMSTLRSERPVYPHSRFLRCVLIVIP